MFLKELKRLEKYSLLLQNKRSDVSNFHMHYVKNI